VRDGRSFEKSLLFQYSGGDKDALSNALFDRALEVRDSFAVRVLCRLVRPVAHAINEISAIAGVRDFYVVGGFVHAKGGLYLELLMQSLREIKFLNREPGFFDGHVEAGYCDEGDGMRGAGYLALGRCSLDGALPAGHLKEIEDERGRRAVEAFAPTEIRYRNYFTRSAFSGTSAAGAAC
jgi:predicted NBD/HSP70 family sugar kinase